MFAVLAVSPLIVLGVFQYAHATNAVRDLLRAHTSAIVTRVAAQVANRVAVVRADLQLLANNADVARLLATGTGRVEAERFTRDALRTFQERFDDVVFQDAAGTEVLRIASSDTLPQRGDTRYGGEPRRHFEVPIESDGRTLGSMTTSIALDALVPASAIDAHVGLGGYTMLIDRATNGVLEGGRDEMIAPPLVAALDSIDPSDPRPIVSYTEGDSARIASIAFIGGTGMAVIASAAVAEYATPLASDRVMNLLMALGVAAAMALAFLLLARRVTRPLETLTVAAGEVGRGNLHPQLPAETSDEVGQLAAAFRVMGARIAEAMRQIESSRQMAAVGAFAAQISHEIRNPLTSIKLNLQSVAREVAGRGQSETERRLAICLREIQRLDGVVRSVLRLGEPAALSESVVSIHNVIREATELTQPQLAAARIELVLDLDAPVDSVRGRAPALRGAFLNIVLNAADMLPHGGRVRVRTALAPNDASMLRVTVADTGPGVAAELRERIFEPFYSTKPGGSGLGLALAARDVEKHHGRLAVVDAPDGEDLGGATFAIDLPIAENSLASRHE